MGIVFISYRREQTAGEARALYNDLAELLGLGRVFMDVDDIALGRDFREVLRSRLDDCELLLALIGRDWLNARDAAGGRRLDSASDFVRLEVATALQRGIAVTPLLLQGARMPAPEDLPDDLKDLAFRNGFEISHTRWQSDVRELVRRLGLAAPSAPSVAPAVPPSSPARPAERRTPVLALAAVAVAIAAGVGWFALGRTGPPPSVAAGTSGTSTATAAGAVGAAPADAASRSPANGPTSTPVAALPQASSGALRSRVAVPPAAMSSPAAALSEAPVPSGTAAATTGAISAMTASSSTAAPTPAITSADSAPPRRAAQVATRSAALPAATTPTPPEPAAAHGDIERLIAELHDRTPSVRRSASERLQREYAGSPVAVRLAVDQLGDGAFGQIGKEGRVATLQFLVTSRDSAWSPAQRAEAADAVRRIRGRVARGQVRMLPDVLELVDRLAARVGA